ncbi:MAG: preprotein translocase subunit SecY [Holophagaceae bacterium]|nr:preprotein translocase subunit SecY [Holophagaceae bacterium]
MEYIRQIFTNPELRKRLIFTLVMLAIFRLGVHVSVPGVNVDALQAALHGKAGDLTGIIDLFSGGGFKKFSIFALGITPYITASIVLQLMGAVIPQLEQLQKKEGEAGRRKINQWTRYLTVGLSFIQGLGIATLAQSFGEEVVPNADISFKLMCAFTLATGTVFIMWIGEQITERGIGNGISLMIFAGIVSGLPRGVQTIADKFVESIRGTGQNQTPPGFYFLLIAVMIAVLLAVVMMENSYRRIPIHYARRVDSSRMASQRSSYLPLKVNTGGVMPVIFASSVIYFPATIAQFARWEWLQKAASYISYDSHFWIYTPVFVGIVVFFAFFYTSIVFNPDETAENMKRSGGYIPGIRPGKETSIYMDGILSKLTFVGALYLAVVSIVPLILMKNVPGMSNIYYGGTSLLIVVGVAMDTVAQFNSHQAMRRYDGFLEKGRIRSNKGGRGPVVRVN